MRLEPQFEGRVPAGAPLPTRALTDNEVLENIRWFAGPSPRARSVRSLVLSGFTSARLARVSALVAAARDAGSDPVTLHVPVALVDSLPSIDAVISVAVRSEAEAAAVRKAVRVTLPLDARGLASLPQVLDSLADPASVTLLWPLPGPGVAPPPAAAEVVGTIRAALPALARHQWGVKGLPPCALAPLSSDVPDLSERLRRSANRWYVDADHQGAAALTFRPDLVRTAKRDGCRFCAVEPRCEGVAEPWLLLDLAGPLRPVEVSS